VTERHSS